MTGDSYIVHVNPVVGAWKAGSYMAKYMVKEFESERAKTLGMARRWSSSRGWPGSGRLCLAQTERGGWTRSSFRFGNVDSDIVGGPAHLMRRSGDNLTLKRRVEETREAFVRKVSRYVEVGSPEDVRGGVQ